MQKDSKRDKIPVASQRAEFISDKPYGEDRLSRGVPGLIGEAMELPTKGLGFAYEKLLPGVASFIGVADEPEGPIYASERLNQTKSGGKKLSAYLSATDLAKAEKAREEDKKEKSRQKKEEDAIIKAALTPEMSKEEARKELLGPQAKKRVEKSDIRKEAQVPKEPEQKILKDVTDAGKGDKKPEDVAKTYMEEFMDMMPEYQGKTGFEKGMDLMKFGMAIAAGESPNAIANISKGFLAMGDTFTKDAAEKRAYEKEIAMAGAQHVLNRQKEDRQFDQELTLRDIDAEADLAEARLKYSAENQKAAYDLIKDSILASDLDPKEADAALDKYGASIKKHGDSANAHKLILKIAQLSAGRGKAQVVGLKGLLNRTMYQASAGVVGLIPNKDGKGFSFDTNAIGSGREATEVRNAALNTLAAKMASVILGESGKTISDRDRQLVRDMLGDISGLGGAFVSEAAIRTRLEQLEEQVLSEMSTADAEINAFEDTYREAVIKGTRGIEQIGGKVFPSEGKRYENIFKAYKQGALTQASRDELAARQSGLGEKGQFQLEGGPVYDYAALPEGASLADVLRAQAES